ncbi:MAG: glycosyltransferase family 2 protein, partial [Pseudomonadota bacterium]
MTDLTIIVTFYDEVAFLRSALTSIAVQTLASVDVLVINDNPDRFDAAALEALTEGFDVRVVHHAENQGLSAARNTGLKAARGRWVGFLDADDYYTLGGLRAQLDYAEETQADIVHAPCLLGTAGTAQARVLMRDAALHMQRRVVRGRMAAQEAQFIVSSWSSLYRTEFLRDNGLRFDPEQRKFEDRLFVLHTVTAAQKIAFTGRPARVWRQRADSISSAPTSPETHLLQVQLLEKCRTHMDAQALPARFAKRELFNCVSRLIWDMDILPHLAAGTNPAYVAMGQRIQALLGEDSFGAAIFDDPMVAATSRVGMRTRKGRIRRTDFFALHKALREGDFAQAQEIMQARAPQPAQAAKGIAHPG